MNKKSLLILSAVGCFVAFASHGQPPERALGNFTRVMILEERLRGIEPRCENGYIAILDTNVYHDAPLLKRLETSGTPRVLVYGGTGRRERILDLGLPNAVDVKPVNVSISRQGVVAVAGSAISADGTAASLILLFDKSGSPSLVIRTTPFAATRVVLSSDGHVWALGTNKDAVKRGQDYSVFQKYTLDGRLVGQFIPRSTFSAPSRVGNIGAHAGGGNGGSTNIRASQNRVGAYISWTGEWIELDNDGNLAGRWKPKLPFDSPDTENPGIAFTDSGSLYMQFRLGYQAVVCRLDRTAGVWEPIAGTRREAHGPTPTAVRLDGADGNQLVFAGPDGRFYWFDEPR